ncbi:hypothetical protein MB09_05220 [Aequorivita vladivostokensis]|uniref:Polysaccharide biosynthesis protein n=1 Tax=Aequorivita vladivostokensis TaxID=171194 RepID=A0ABR5DJA5_9FLAO|nr:hypothetical protein MB09_05220 [Aequorivita vladivostokensis]
MNFKSYSEQLLQRLLKNQLFKDSFWSLAGNVIGRGLALLAGILVARFLGKDVFGEYGIIRNTILTIGVFSTFGLGYTATKYIADLKTSKPFLIRTFISYAIQITLIFSGLMAVGLFIFAALISEELLGVAHLTLPLRLLSILIIFNALTTTQVGILSGFGKFKAMAKINMSMGILTFIFSGILAYYFELEGALLALLLVQVLNFLFNFFLVKKSVKSFPKSLSKDKKFRKGIIQFSTPIALQEAVYSLTSWLGYLLLVNYASFGELGMYSAAMQWNAIVLFIPGILRNVILSHLSATASNDKRHGTILKQIIVVNLGATLVPFIGILLFSSWISSFYGQTFQGLDDVLTLAVFSTIAISVSNVFAQAYTSIGKNWQMLIFRMIRDILILGCFLILINLISVRPALIMIYSQLFTNFLFLIIISINYKMIRKWEINY